MTPTARTLAELRARGYTAEVVEQIIRIPGRNGQPPRVFRRDLYGFGDVLAFKLGEPVLIVQACITSDQANRLAKIRNTATARLWLVAGNRIAVWGWAKRGPRGQRKVWTASVTVVLAEDCRELGRAVRERRRARDGRERLDRR
jgi:hypothetical protein